MPLNGSNNVTLDFTKSPLNPYFNDIYLLIIAVYSFLIVSSLFANFAMVYHIIKYDLHKEPTCAFLINIAIANLIHLVLVMPLSLAVMLIQYWIFGEFICVCLPMLQDLSPHVSMMTYLLIASDRFRLLSDPRKPRIPAFVCALGTWFFASCIVLPYPIYVTYLDVPDDYDNSGHDKHLILGRQLCLGNLEEDIQEYMRSLFIGTYIVPLTITAYIYVKSGQELQSQEGPLAIAIYKSRPKNSTSYSRQGSNASNDIAYSKEVLHLRRTTTSFDEAGYDLTSSMPCQVLSTLHSTQDLNRLFKDYSNKGMDSSLCGTLTGTVILCVCVRVIGVCAPSSRSRLAGFRVRLTIQGARGSESVGTSGTAAFSNLSTSYDLDDHELDIQKEKRTQKYLIFMVTIFAICLCPLNIVKLARAAVQETKDNSSHISMTYIIVVWLSILPALTTPCLYASWQMSRLAKERLRGYFRFSNRRHTRVCEDSQRPPSRRSRHHAGQAASGCSNSAGTSRSRAGSNNSCNSSGAAIIVGSSCGSSGPRSPRTSNVAPPDSPDLSVSGYNSYKSSLVP